MLNIYDTVTVEGFTVGLADVDAEQMATMFETDHETAQDILGTCADIRGLNPFYDFMVMVNTESVDILCEGRTAEEAETLLETVFLHEVGHLHSIIHDDDYSEEAADDVAWDLCEELGIDTWVLEKMDEEREAA